LLEHIKIYVARFHLFLVNYDAKSKNFSASTAFIYTTFSMSKNQTDARGEASSDKLRKVLKLKCFSRELKVSDRSLGRFFVEGVRAKRSFCRNFSAYEQAFLTATD
jgi:hypothetical protein